jgi:hypothetical protein
MPIEAAPSQAVLQALACMQPEGSRGGRLPRHRHGVGYGKPGGSQAAGGQLGEAQEQEGEDVEYWEEDQLQDPLLQPYLQPRSGGISILPPKAAVAAACSAVDQAAGSLLLEAAPEALEEAAAPQLLAAAAPLSRAASPQLPAAPVPMEQDQEQPAAPQQQPSARSASPALAASPQPFERSASPAVALYQQTPPQQPSERSASPGLEAFTTPEGARATPRLAQTLLAEFCACLPGERWHARCPCCVRAHCPAALQQHESSMAGLQSNNQAAVTLNPRQRLGTAACHMPAGTNAYTLLQPTYVTHAIPHPSGIPSAAPLYQCSVFLPSNRWVMAGAASALGCSCCAAVLPAPKQ